MSTKNARIVTVSGLVLGLVILIGINLLSSTLVRSARVDLTQEGLYTLSDGSRGVLDSLLEPVTLRLFLSRDLVTRLPGINAYATRVQDLLEEFARAGGEKLRLDIVDPEPFSEAEDRAVAYGLEGVPLEDGDTLFYFGLVASGPAGDDEVIPFFSVAREDFLEYDITRLVHQVSNPKPRVVGLLSALPMDGSPGPGGFMGQLPQPWVMYRQMQQFFDVRSIPADIDRIPGDVDVLMVVRPDRLGEGALYAVDQFVLGGGHAIVFVDGYAEGDESGPMGGFSSKKGFAFDGLLAQWGLKLRPDTVAADINLASRVRTRANDRTVVIDYPVWMNLRPELYDHADVVTGELGDVVMASPGVLDVVARDGVTVTPLIRTTESATVVEPARLAPGADLTALVRNYEPGGEPLILAARVSGKTTTAFPDGPPASGEDAATKSDDGGTSEDADTPAPLAESQGDINVIVVADTDMLRDRFWVTTQNLLGTELAIPTAANNALVINSLENLTGDENLISIRSRGGHKRTFTLLEDVRRDAERRYRQKEQELLDELDTTEKRLAELQQQRSGGEGLMLSPEQQAELDRFRERKVGIRKELRAVRRNLRENIESIQSWVRFVNIALVPLVVGIGGLAFAASRHGRGRKRDV